MPAVVVTATLVLAGIVVHANHSKSVTFQTSATGGLAAPISAPPPVISQVRSAETVEHMSGEVSVPSPITRVAATHSNERAEFHPDVVTAQRAAVELQTLAEQMATLHREVASNRYDVVQIRALLDDIRKFAGQIDQSLGSIDLKSNNMELQKTRLENQSSFLNTSKP